LSRALLATLLITGLRTGTVQARPGQFGESRFKGRQLPSGLGDVFGKVQEFTGGQSADDEARSGDAIAATVLGAAPVWRNPAAQNYVIWSAATWPGR